MGAKLGRSHRGNKKIEGVCERDANEDILN
jgi:hypothetical protein